MLKRRESKKVEAPTTNEIKTDYALLEEKERLRVYLQEKFLPYLQKKYQATLQLRQQFQGRVTALSQLSAFLQKNNKIQQEPTHNQLYVDGVVGISAPYLKGIQYRLDAEDIESQIAETVKMLEMLPSITDRMVLYTWGEKVGQPINPPIKAMTDEDATNIASKGTFLSISSQPTKFTSTRFDDDWESSSDQKKVPSSWKSNKKTGPYVEMGIFQDSSNVGKSLDTLHQKVGKIEKVDPQILKFGLFHTIIHNEFWEITPNQMTVVSNPRQGQREVLAGIKGARKCKTFDELFKYAQSRVGDEKSPAVTALLVTILAAKDPDLERVKEDIQKFQQEHMTFETKEQFSQPQNDNSSTNSRSGIAAFITDGFNKISGAN